MTTNSYPLGATVRIKTATPFAVAGVPTDPTTITLKIEWGDGTEATYTYANSEITRAGTGDYYREVLLTIPGALTYRWQSTGAVAAADEDVLYVLSSAFAYP